MTQIEAQATEHAAEAAAEGFNAGEVIIEHVANSGLDHPLIHLPTIGGIDFSVTKHVFMLWVVAAVVFLVDHDDRAPVPAAGPPGADRLHERARSRSSSSSATRSWRRASGRSGPRPGRRCC